MHVSQFKFSQKSDNDFHKVLRQRVNDYFKQQDLSKYGGISMLFKAVFMLGLYFIPVIVFLVTDLHILIQLLLWIIMGVGMAGIGLSVMHDANHGAFSKSPLVNKLAGLTANVIGGHAKLWKLQHNVLHHTFTNVIDADDDISTSSILRFSPNHPLKKIHKYQHIFAFFLYTLMTFSWSVWADYTQAVRFKQKGLFKQDAFKKDMVNIILWKIIYFSYLIIVPIFVFDKSWWLVLLGFMVMSMVCGWILSVIFQLAHVMPNCDFPVSDEKGVIDNSWAVHQLHTTSNFSQKSKLFSWYIGGLNYQIEHHLFSNICHVHYPKIAKIVKQTAAEFNLPYYDNGNFFKAMVQHYKMLKFLGNPS